MTDSVAPGFWVAIRPPRGNGETRVEQTRLVSMDFEDIESMADKLSLVVDNYDLTQLDSPLWQPGNVVVFQFGYPGAMSPVRRMTIQKVKGFEKLTVEAHGDESQMNKVHGDGSERWNQKKRSDVAIEIAKKYGFTDDQIFVQDTEVVLPQITKATMTDLQILRSMAEREGFEFYCDFDGFHFHTQNTKRPPLKTYTYFAENGRGEIIGYPQMADDRAPGKPGGFIFTGRDPVTKETFTVRGDDATASALTALAPSRTAFSPEDANAPPGLGQLWPTRTTELTREAAQRAAIGTYKRAQLRAVEMSLTLRGDGTLLAKNIIRVLGLGPSMSGNYYVTSVKHTLGAGYRMVAKIKRDGRSEMIGDGSALPATTAKTDAQKNNQTDAPPEMVTRRALNADGQWVTITRPKGSYD